MKQQNSLMNKQMHHKFKLEETKSNFFKNLKTYNLNVFLDYSCPQLVAQTCYQSHHAL